MKKVRVGLAGCGSVSQRGLIPHLAQDDIGDRVIFQAVMDPVEGRADGIAAKYGIPRAFTDYDRMLDGGEVDLVVIASPIGFHYEQGLKAVRRGKHVHFNKTMTTTKAEADAVIVAAQEEGVTLVASPGQMQRPQHREAKRLLDEGYIGRIYFGSVGMGFRGHEYESFRAAGDVLTDVNPLWYYQRRAGGGPMYDAVVYRLHTLTGILGPAQRVTGMSGIGLKERHYGERSVTVDMDDNTHLLLDFGDGVYAQVFGVFSSTPRRPPIQFAGSAGSMDIGYEGVTVYGDPDLIGMSGGVLRSTRPFGELPYVSGVHVDIPEKHVYSDIMHLVDCVINDKQPLVTAEHARHVIEIIEAGYRAAEMGATQELTTVF